MCPASRAAEIQRAFETAGNRLGLACTGSIQRRGPGNSIEMLRGSFGAFSVVGTVGFSKDLFDGESSEAFSVKVYVSGLPGGLRLKRWRRFGFHRGWRRLPTPGRRGWGVQADDAGELDRYLTPDRISRLVGLLVGPGRAVHITGDGVEVSSAAIPTTTEQIEAMVTRAVRAGGELAN